MTTLIVIRHGESEGNKGGYFTGNVNVSLTDMGRKQALMVRDYLKEYKIDKVYSSDLDRAYETALPIAEYHGVEVEKRPGIREINGGKWERMVYADIKEQYGDEYNVWLEDMGNALCTDGESVAQLSERVEKEINSIIAENEGKTIAVVCHGTPIRALACIWKNVDIQDMQDVPWVSNASVSVVKYSDISIPPEIVLYGYTEHLKDCATFLPETV